MNKKETEKELRELKERVDTFEDINFKYISKGGAVKMISWGKDYKQWTAEKRLEYAEALASAMNEACDVIQQERNKLIDDKERLEATLVEAEKGLYTLRETNIRMITDCNRDKQDLIKRIRELESDLITSKNQLVE